MAGLLRKLQKAPLRLEHTESPVALGIEENELPTIIEGKTVVKRKSLKPLTQTRPSLSDDAPFQWPERERKFPPKLEPVLQRAADRLRESLERDEAHSETAITSAINEAAHPVSMNRKERDIAHRELEYILEGGPLNPLFEEPTVSHIYVDDFKTVKVLRRGQLIRTPYSFRSREEYALYITWLLKQHGHRLGADSPIVDFTLPDRFRSRVNIIEPSIGNCDEPRLSIRIPRPQQLSFLDILQTKVLPATLAAWLSEVVSLREANILIVGPYGAGKTVMMTALLGGASSEERILTIEDVPEIFVAGSNVEKLVHRPDKHRIPFERLFQAAVRRTPHRIVVGELSEEQGVHFLKTLEGGFAGSMASLHARSAEEGLWRFADMVAAHDRVSERSLVRRVSNVIQLVITMGKSEGRPVLLNVCEVRAGVGGEGRDPEFEIVPLVQFDGVSEGKRRWRLLRNKSYWVDYLKSRGKNLRPGLGLYSEAYQDDVPEGGGTHREEL